jgi:hypothetical protein
VGFPGVPLARRPRSSRRVSRRLSLRHPRLEGRRNRHRRLPLPHPPGSPSQIEGRTAVFYGPWLLAVDEAASPNYFDETSSQNKVDLAASGGDFELEPVPPSPASAPFTVPVAHFKLRYLPAGYPVQPQSALLRPMAEFTAEPDNSRLEFWLPIVLKKD